ncbi:glycine receptor subunit alphaZ1-like [Mercenaria mercenaria]|uniref:glycine receptor subunit alphaZ1-like n=1 Tax=Mercenaria mercenaria TaxID=6596 RepID=UPI00234EA50D|nr:glycine receptor subunit alphaZ1-like [Mercenaria mercenaria]
MFLCRVLIYTALLVKYCGSCTKKLRDFNDRNDFSDFLKEEDMQFRALPSKEDGRAAVVTVELAIESFDSINENDMDISLTFLLRFSFKNDHLGQYGVTDVDKVVFDNELVDRLWTPELYFLNEKRVYVHKTFVPNKKYTFYIGGNVTYSSRFSLTAGCPMDFRAYPFDKQTCMIAMESFLHDEQAIVLKWKANNPVVLKGNSGTALPNFHLLNIETNKITVQNEDGNFSCASMELHFVRNMGYYLMQMYIPCVISVIISWISFWIDVNAASERLGLGVVTVLTMVTHNADVNSQLPKVSYTKAIDVYTSTCLVLVFLALLQYLVVYIYAQRRSGDEKGDDMQTNRRYQSVALKIDVASRIVFPCVFLVFNMCIGVSFWIYCTETNDFSRNRYKFCLTLFV